MAENFLEEQREMVIKLCVEGLRHTDYSGREMKINLGAEKTPVGCYTTAKWISVKDRLPELHTKVLCCGIKGGRFIAELGTWGHERHLCWDKKNGRGCPEVTHWMPLPEPPKEDKDNENT